MNDSFAIERLTAAEIPHNVALARAVGWPDVEDDWRVIHEAATVVGMKCSRERVLAARLRGAMAWG
jgi:hypothetical protein